MTEQRARELLPCPFCGGEAKMRSSSDGDVEWASCPSCRISGPLKLSTANAVAAWNTRATPFAESAKSPSDSVREALELAANRLNRLAVDAIAAGSPKRFEIIEWADHARAALQSSEAGNG